MQWLIYAAQSMIAGEGLLIWAHCAVHAAPLAPANFIDRKDWAKSVELNVNATSILISMISPLLGQQGTAIIF